MKFNMFNWILETVSTFMVLIFINRIITLIYILIMSSGTPIVYFMGIEENRNKAKEYFKSNMRIFSSGKVQPSSEQPIQTKSQQDTISASA